MEFKTEELDASQSQQGELTEGKGGGKLTFDRERLSYQNYQVQTVPHVHQSDRLSRAQTLWAVGIPFASTHILSQSVQNVFHNTAPP